MTGTAASHPAGSERVLPLLRGDPPRLGDIALSGRLEVTDAAIVYAGVLADEPVAVAMLTAGAESDGYARARFHDAVRDARLAGTDTVVVAGEEEPAIAPWVAVRAASWADGAKLAAALLAPVTVEHLRPIGTPSGPGFRPHWHPRRGPGRWRAWPLPWPPALSAAGRWTYVASFALVLAISSIALFIAVKVFENQPPAPIGPPYPSPGPATPSTGTTSPNLPSIPPTSHPSQVAPVVVTLPTNSPHHVPAG